MNHLDYFSLAKRPVETCVVGSGGFGRSFIAQGLRVPLMNVRVAVDIDGAVAARSFAAVGVFAGDVAICATADEAARAWADGKYIAAADLGVVLGLPIDVVVEATGNPEAGARHGRMAVEAGHHLVLVSKEVDSVVGPCLAARARRRGRVATPVDGDQPSLLIGLITWARTLGFEIVAAGKASEYDFVFDEVSGVLTCNGAAHELPALAEHMTLGGRAAEELTQARARVCAALPQRAVPDLCELLVVANSTGLVPDRPDLHAPIARIPEVPTLFGLAAEDGLLGRAGALDVFHCLRRPEEASFAGGVFIVVRCDDAPTWKLLEEKGHLVSRNGKYAMIFNPRHLLGLEAATSVLEAALYGRSCGAQEPFPHLDLVARATRRLAAGSSLLMGGHHHAIAGTSAELHAARPLAPGNPAPFYLAANRRLTRDVEAGALIALADIEIDPASELLALRRQQDALFPGGAAN
ncbi:MAG: flagellar biosynthesis protein FlgA [Candidatus Accumulibacter sp.]|jgi:predicted homoserine dehydrogenase-like protein|nr:flagellar biosynthesis protein FlgA [Accumulibacter sp.]